MENKKQIAVAAIAILLALVFVGWLMFTPNGVSNWNNWVFSVQKAYDSSAYETKRKVEDTCRSMIASYTSDRLTYDQYAGSDDAEKKSWAEQAKMRANKTAASYNEYILKNSFVWDGNIPHDICADLEYVK